MGNDLEVELDLLDDNRYLAKEAALREIKEVLASLELDRHRLRIQLAMNGMDGDAKLQSGLTINEAIQMANKRIAAVENTFGDLLDGDEGDN